MLGGETKSFPRTSRCMLNIKCEVVVVVIVVVVAAAAVVVVTAVVIVADFSVPVRLAPCLTRSNAALTWPVTGPLCCFNL